MGALNSCGTGYQPVILNSNRGLAARATREFQNFVAWASLARFSIRNALAGWPRHGNSKTAIRDPMVIVVAEATTPL